MQSETHAKITVQDLSLYHTCRLSPLLFLVPQPWSWWQQFKWS